MAECLATLPPSVVWKVGNVTSELCDLAKKISGQMSKGLPDFFLLLGVKGERREKLKE